MAVFSQAHLDIIDQRIATGINNQIANTRTLITQAVEVHNAYITARLGAAIEGVNE